MPVGKGQKNRRLLVGIVLDASGSMQSIKAETISNTNEQFSSLRDSDDADNTYVAMWTFNSDVRPTFTNPDGSVKLVPCKNLQDISDADYKPSATTAMFDAVGDATVFFEAEAKPADDVLIVIISDGLNNASRRFTSEVIASRVKELQDSGWNFTYIGANQDLTKVQANLGIHAGNMYSFSANPEGTVAMGTDVRSAIRGYTISRSDMLKTGHTGRVATRSLYEDQSEDNIVLVNTPTGSNKTED